MPPQPKMHCRCALAAPLLIVAAATLLGGHVQAGGFVQRQGNQLMLDGKPFYFLGFNAYWLIDAVKTGDGEAVNRLFQGAKDAGLHVGRTWAFNHNLPSSPGVYSENEFVPLDNVIATAGNHGLRLILVLGNFWKAYLGSEKFMAWANEQGDVLDFYNSTAARALYKQHLQAIVTRVNTVTGVAYKDDPTIMTWNIMNEPRCPGCTNESQQQVHLSWLSEMSSFVKGIAPKQLVVAGTEGFYMDSANLGYNPGTGSSCEGEDWLAVYRTVTSFDYANIHVYARLHEAIPPSWTPCDRVCYLNWASNSIRLKTQQAQALGVPLVLEEFGANPLHEPFTAQQGVEYFALIYQLLEQSKASGSPLMGGLFWNAEVTGWVDYAGYNVALDGPRSNGASAPAVSAYSSSASPSGNTTSGGRKLLAGNGKAAASQLGRRELVLTPARKLQELDLALDDFRRGQQRSACNQALGNGWRPAHGWGGDGSNGVDMDGFQRQCAGKTLLDVIADAAAVMNG